MIKIMPDMPEGTLGFRISGDLARDDYAKVLVPRLREVMERGQPLRLLLEVETDFSAEPGAVLEGIKADVELGIAHRKAWRRIALVTDLAWMGKAVQLPSWLSPGEMRAFPLREMDAAKAWVAE